MLLDEHDCPIVRLTVSRRRTQVPWSFLRLTVSRRRTGTAALKARQYAYG